MTQIIRLTGWFAAVNAIVIAATLGLGVTGESIAAGTRTFVAWCGIG